MPSDKLLNQLIENALYCLDTALSEVMELSQEGNKEFYQIGKLGRSIGLLREFQRPLFEKCPEFKSEIPYLNEEPPSLTDKQKLFVERLTQDEIDAIDSELLSYANRGFQKVAKIVAQFIINSNLNDPDLSDIFIAQRVKALVEQGKLVGQGDLNHMRFSEVRLP